MNRLATTLLAAIVASCIPCLAAEPATGLNGATGNIFKVDLQSKTFELLKETEYDPKTNTAQSRFTVHWDTETKITKAGEVTSFADLEKGFWQTTIKGSEKDGRFLIERMEITPLPDPLATDDPKLPRVLIIGDSISMNYFETAKAELKGIANLHRNEGNAGPSSRGVSNTELWLGDCTEKGRHWDVIQFNHGLHDLKQVYDKKTDTFGAYSVPMEEYQANLEKQIAILKKTGAKLIWCATTPVPNDNKSQYARRKGASADYNKAALEVMAKHPEIQVNDLHATVTESPVFDNWRKTIDVHFYKAEETQSLGKAVAAAVKKALEKPSKKLPLPGETFSVNGRTAFLILPETRPPGKPTPWIWYAPTLPKLPANEEKWMFEKLLEKSIAIAGIDVGESMGSPAGVADYSALHEELVTHRGMSKTPSLLARSRGGLMLYNWAVTHPDSVSAIAGIYPVGNLASYPGLDRAAPAYGMTKDELAKRLAEFNPVDRLAPLAEAKVPIMHLHGDSDKVVPIEKNSGMLKERYEKLGGEMKLDLVKGGGHDMNPHWFRSQELVDFLIEHAK